MTDTTSAARSPSSGNTTIAASATDAGVVSDRLHGLDAVRAFALLSGVVLHSTLAYVMQPGQWGIGAARPDLVLWAFVHYVHDFRMQLFFLLAGFFGAMVVGRRGARAYLRDRLVRIGLVFVVLVYPLKLLISLPWIAGGLKTGWLQLPAETARLPLLVLAIGGLREETWPAISPGHLWFLYYLFLVTVVFMAARWILARTATARTPVVGSPLSRRLAAVAAHPLGPIVLALPVIPLLGLTPGAVLASPDRGFLPDSLALAIYGLCFSFGWWLHGRQALLGAFARRWALWLALSLGAAALSFAIEVQRQTVGIEPGLHWLAATANALTLSLACLGWIGFFVDRFSAPSPVVRYLADASYWVYLIHLPIVVAVQVWVSDWGFLPAQLLTINVVTFAVSLASYHLIVRDTPIGAWLNGRRNPSRARAVGSTGTV